MAKENKNRKKLSRRQLAVRITCFVLAGILAISTAAIILSIIFAK